MMMETAVRLLPALTLLSSLAFALPALSADRTMIVLDASGSMWGQIDGKSKMEIARETLGNVLQSVPKESELGLMVYGHRDKGSCSDIELVVPAAAGTGDAISSFANGINPKGKTPISDAVRQAAESLRYTEDKATVVLVTDGLETCQADPCAIASELEKSGVDFTAHVVGFGLTEEEGRQVACLAENTGGKYFQASDAGQLVAALAATVAEAPMIKEAVEAQPEPEPVKVEYNVMPDSTLVEGGPSLGGNTDVFWQIFKAGANGEPEGDHIDSQYLGSYSASYPAGKYVAVATLNSSIKRSVPFEAKDGEIVKPSVIFDAGQVVITPKRTAQDAAPDDSAAVLIAFGDYSTTYYGRAKFYAAAGNLSVKGTIGPATAEASYVVKAGETAEYDLVIASGVALTKAVYAEAGPDVDSSSIFFEVVESKKNIDGNRKSVIYAYGTGSKLDVPPGDYVLTAKLGVATGETAFTSKAGEMVEVQVNINGGVLFIKAPDADFIEVLEAKKDIQGNRNSVTYAYGVEHQDTVPPGDYIVRTTYKGDIAPKETAVTVKAGERAEVTVQ